MVKKNCTECKFVLFCRSIESSTESSNEKETDYEDRCERERYGSMLPHFILIIWAYHFTYIFYRQYKKIYVLEAEIKKLKEELEVQQRQLHEHQEEMKKIFSANQLLQSESNNWQNYEWTIQDISSAISMHTAESRAYSTHLRKHYPLPSFSTLKTWAPKARIQNNG